MGTFQKPACLVFLLIMAVFIVITYVHDVTRMAVLNDFADFGSYYFYSKAMNLKYNAYRLDDAAIDGLRTKFGMPVFNYPTLQSPIFFFLIGFITFFKFRPAAVVWLILNSALVLASLLLIVGMICEERKDIEKWFLLLTSLFLVFAFQPLLENMAVGQVNVPILFFLALCLYFLRRSRPALAGIMLSFAILIKMHFGLLLLFFLWKRRYRVIISTAAAWVLLELAGMLRYGPAIEKDYWITCGEFFFGRVARDISLGNYSIGPLICRVCADHFCNKFPLIVSGGIIVISLFFAAYALYHTRRAYAGTDMRFMLEFSLFLLAIFITFPHILDHHHVILYIPILLVWALLIERYDRGAFIAFLCSFLLIALKYAFGRFPMLKSGVLSIITGLKIYGVILLFFLAAYMIRKRFQKIGEGGS